MTMSSYSPETDYAPEEFTFIRPGNDSYYGEVPRFLPEWQYRVDYDDNLHESVMHHPSCKGVWTYEPFSGEDDEPTFEIMSDEEINRHDERLAAWNAQLAQFSGTTSTNHLHHSLWVLYSDKPIAPTGIDAPNIIRLQDSPRIPTKSGYFEMHIAFDSAEALEHYKNDADEVYSSMCESLELIDMRRIDMSLETLVGMLCMIEVRRIVDELTDEMSVDVSRNVTDYAFIEQRFINSGATVTVEKWAFAQAIYDACEALNLFV